VDRSAYKNCALSSASSFYLEASDNVAVFSAANFKLVLLLRKLFASQLIIVNFSGEDIININDRVQVLGEAEEALTNIIGPISDKNWKLNLIMEYPYIGNRFVKCWDSGLFKLSSL
jgi:hypothetical protein